MANRRTGSIERNARGRLRPILAVLGLALAAALNPAQAGVTPPELERLRDDIKTLASPAFEGRRGRGAATAADFLEERFRDLKLDPLFDGKFRQEIEGDLPGQNVGAVLKGSDPALRDEYVVVSAHFDHLGVRNGVLYPGADDNASGTAVMLEIARTLASAPRAPRRSVIFLGFDLEEYGLVGSAYFVEHPPVPLDQIKLFITSDMIARALGGVVKPYVFVMGTEHAPGLRPLVEQNAAGLPLKVGVVGSDLLVVDRSDYGPFRLRKIPYLFFSTGENPAYHSPEDRPETLDYEKLQAVACLIQGIVVAAADRDDLPTWTDETDRPINEARALEDVLRSLLDHQDVLKLKPFQRLFIQAQIRLLEGVLERGVVTTFERQQMLRGAQIILYSIL